MDEVVGDKVPGLGHLRPIRQRIKLLISANGISPQEALNNMDSMLAMEKRPIERETGK